jgi:hypothetical protein
LPTDLTGITGSEAVGEITNQWGTISFEVPDFIKPIRDNINNAFQFLISVLDIALKILNFIKSFLIGFLDPIVAAVQAILDEITALVNDIRQMGLYMTGDWKLLNYPYEDLKGGFQAYQRRMIARMTDRTDPTRPDVSSLTTTFGMFFYMSVDISEIMRLIAYIKQLMGFFNQEFLQPGGYPVPSINSISYGSSTANIMTAYDLGSYLTRFNGTPPQIAEIRWTLNQTTPIDTFNPFPAMPPKGFIITVSTFPNGLPVFFDRPMSSTKMAPNTNDPAKKQQPRNYGAVREKDTGKPLVIYGGADNVLVNSDINYIDSFQDGKLKSGRTRVYGLRSVSDNAPVPLEYLKKDGKYYFQRMFYMSAAETGNQWVTNQFMFHLKMDDLPHDAKLTVDSVTGQVTLTDAGPATTVYVRVASCYNANIIKNESFVYNFAETAFQTMKDSTGLHFPVAPLIQGGTSPSDLSAFSNNVQVIFPNANTQEYFKALKTALLLLVLVRPDLIPLDQIKPTLTPTLYEAVKNNKVLLPGICLEGCGLEDFRQLTGILFEDYQTALQAKNAKVSDFINYLRKHIDAFVQDLYDASGPMPELEKMIVDNTQELRKTTWSTVLEKSSYNNHQYKMKLNSTLDTQTLIMGKGNSFGEQTLWESVATPVYGESGIGINPFCIGVTPDSVSSLFTTKGVIQGRLPQMQEVAPTDESFSTASLTATKKEAEAIMKYGAPSLRIFYEKSIQPDGSIKIPAIAENYFTDMTHKYDRAGSADSSPVLYINTPVLENLFMQPQDAAVIYCRGLFTSSTSNQKLLDQAALVLGAATAALKRTKQDGQWLTYRFFDTLPGMQDFFASIQNWVEAVRATLTSIVDTIRKYIEFIEARIVELQQLLRRINSLIQSILSFAFQIPKASGLMLVSNGTDGLLSDFVSAKNKPSDSPLAYGAGIAIVMPVGAPFVLDLIKALFIWTNEEPSGYMAPETPPFPAAVGPPLPPPALPPGDDVPPETL